MNAMQYLFVGFLEVFIQVYCMLVVIRPLRSQLGHLPLLVFAGALACGLFGHSHSEVKQAYNIPFGVGDLALRGGSRALLGLVFGLPCAFAAELMPMSGRILDMSRGAGFSEQLMPGSAERASILEQCGLLLVPLFVFAGGAYQELYVLLLRSIETTLGSPNQSIWLIRPSELAWLSLEALRTAVLVCTPCILVCLILDLCIALLSRSLGRVNMVFEALPLKVVGGLFVVWIVLLAASPEPALRLWDNALTLLEHPSAESQAQKGRIGLNAG